MRNFIKVILGCAISLSLGYCQENTQPLASNTGNIERILKEEDTTIKQEKLVSDKAAPEYLSDLEVRTLFGGIVESSWGEYGVELSKEVFRNNPNCSLDVLKYEIASVGEQIKQIHRGYGLDAAKQTYSSFFSKIYAEGVEKCGPRFTGVTIDDFITKSIPLLVRWEHLLDKIRDNFNEECPTRIYSWSIRGDVLNLMEEFSGRERRDKISLFCEGKRNLFTEPLVFLEPDGEYRVSIRPELFCRQVLQRFPDDFRYSVSWGRIPEIELGYDYNDIFEDSEGFYNAETAAAKRRFAKEAAEEICKKYDSLPLEQFRVYRDLMIRNIKIISGVVYDWHFEQGVIDSVYDICLE